MKIFRLLAVSITFIVTLLGALSTYAGTMDRLTDAGLVRGAELVFEGVVINVKYLQAVQETGNEGYTEIPYTLVTFGVEKVLKGSPEQTGEITLRFLGGPASDGRILMLNHSPVFEVGDRDVLFVKSNGVAWCPLVGWDQGRFRIVDNRVYSNQGEEVLLGRKENRVRFGDKHSLPEVMVDNVGDAVFMRERPQPHSHEQKTSDRHLNRSEFLEHVQQLVKHHHSTEQLSHLPPVRDALFMAPPTNWLARPASGNKNQENHPAPPHGNRPPKPVSEEDQFEQEMLQRNGGNPVLL